MSWLTNLTDDDLEVPSLGVTVPAGESVEVEVPDDFDSPAFKVTKTQPTGAKRRTAQDETPATTEENA